MLQNGQISADFGDFYETERMAEHNKGNCPETISLKIYSMSLTSMLEDNVTQFHDLLLNYIIIPNSIILAVSMSPANAEMATSEAL